MSGLKLVRIAGLLAFSAVAWVGCNTTTTTTPTTTPTQMQWKAGESATYQQTQVDTTTGQSVPGSEVGITTSLATSGLPEFGLPNSQVEVNTYSNSTPTDTSYFNQNANGDLYAYDFGSIGALTTINQLLSRAGLGFSLPNLGWMLQIKMAAGANTTWIAFDTSITENVTVSGFSVPVTLRLSDNATMIADTTFTLSGKSYTCKHALHNFSLALTGTVPLVGQQNLISWNENIETYVSADLAATIKNEAHPSSVDASSLVSAAVGFSTKKFDGVLLQLNAHS